MISEEMKILIPIIRREMPKLFAHEMASTQPVNISGKVLKAIWEQTSNRKYKQGELVHDFAKGWLRYYGTEFIPLDLWLKIKIKGL